MLTWSLETQQGPLSYQAHHLTSLCDYDSFTQEK